MLRCGGWLDSGSRRREARGLRGQHGSGSVLQQRRRPRFKLARAWGGGGRAWPPGKRGSGGRVAHRAAASAAVRCDGRPSSGGRPRASRGPRGQHGSSERVVRQSTVCAAQSFQLITLEQRTYTSFQ
ncbi:hypothetical protein PVAP13_2NG117203 [Panicum virgatum]|uniref:Uncharacterized protein n=1 Tax=Panicum virgatum TaxID=38727 RepID=A0A8T0VI67_PANVG|nr:hypothetical protein PVAP13_2NG117203 [Panicum virgatum]